MIERTVDRIRLASPPTTTPETPVSEAAETLCQPGVSALPVVEDGDAVGVVTAADVVAMVAETEERPPVRTVMSAPVTTESTVTLTDAARRMRTAGVDHLLVVDDGVYYGVVSTDLLAPYLSRHNLDVDRGAEPASVDRFEDGVRTAGD